MNLNQLFNNKKSADDKNLVEGVDPHNFDSDWDYQDALAKSGRSRSSYRSAEDDTFDADVAYSKKMYQLSQQQKAAKDKEQGVSEGSDRVDSLVTDALKIMRGSELNDAVIALKTVLGDREYNSRRGFYNFYVRQLMDMYGKKGVAEGAEFGANYAEQLAQKVFNVRPSLANEDDVLNIGYKVATQDLASQVRANYLFARDQDFPSDFVSAYRWLQKKNSNAAPLEEGTLKDQSLSALMQAKQAIEQQRAAELDAWERDFRANTAKRAGQQLNKALAPAPVAQPGEKHSVLKSRLDNLNAAIQKQQYLDMLAAKAEKLGLMNPGLQADADTSLYVRDGARDNYMTLNQRLDTAIQRFKDRISVRRASGLNEEELDENLRDWFNDKWVRFGPDGKIRGDCARGDDSEGKPKCLPQSKAHSLGKKGRASAAARKRREDPDAERSGKAINVNTKKKTNESELDEACWDTHKQVGMKSKGGKMVPNCVPKESVEEGHQSCPECGGAMYEESMMNEKKDACYYKVKSRYKVWPSAYASGALVKCRKSGADNWGNSGKSNESVAEGLGKSIKRAAQGWGVGGAPDMVTPKGVVQAFGNMDGQRLANFVASRKGQSTPKKGSAGAFADKVIDREMTQRGYGRVADKDEQGVAEDDAGDVEQRMLVKIEKEKQRLAKLKQTDPAAYKREMEKHKQTNRIPPVSTFEDHGVAEDQLDEKWTKKYKDSINCSNPKGFSQKAHCAGRKKNESVAEGTDIDADIENLKYAIRFETPRSVPGEDHRAQYARHAEKIAGYKAELKKLVAQKKQQGVNEGERILDENSPAGQVEAWGYSYNNRDQRVMWRKMFASKEAAMTWADRHNATVLGVRTPGQPVQEGTAHCVECGGPAYLSRYVAEEEKGCYSNHKMGKAQCRNVLETSELDEQAQPAKTLGMRNIGMIEKTRNTAEPVLLDYGSQKFRVLHPADKKWFLDTWRGYRNTGQENRFFEMMGTLVGFEKLLDQYAAFHARQTAPQPKAPRNRQPTQADLLEAPQDDVASPRAKKALTQLRMKYPHAANDSEAMLYSMLDTQKASQQNVDNLEKTVQRDIDTKISKLSDKQLGSAAVNQIKATNDQQQQILNRIIKIDQAQQQAIDDLKSPGDAAKPSTYSRGDLTGVPDAKPATAPAPISMPKPMPIPAVTPVPNVPAVTPIPAVTPAVSEPAAEPAGQGDTRLQIPLPRDKAAPAEPIDIGVAATKPSNVIPMKKPGKKPVQGRLFDPTVAAPVAANVPMGIQRVAEAKKIERKLAKLLQEQSK